MNLLDENYHNKSYFDTIINNNPELICRYNLQKEIEFINWTIYKKTGRFPEYYIGKNLRDFGYPPDFIEKLEKSFDICVSTGYPSSVELSVGTGILAGMYMLVIFVPIFGNDLDYEKIIGVFSVSRDITKEKKLEIMQQQQIEELQILSQKLINKANKLQNFAHIVSHNLRSPVSNLNTLISFYEDAQSEEEKKELMEMLKLSVSRLTVTIEDLTEVVRVNQNIDLKTENIYFQDIVVHIQDSLSAWISETNTTIETSFSACESIRYSKIYLESIFLNLITNAIKYRHPERNLLLQISTQRENEQIILVCKDNGVGIDLSKHGHKVFGLHKTFHGNQDARGVGLFITKNQIESLGGRISVDSIVNIGTTFTIQFN